MSALAIRASTPAEADGLWRLTYRGRDLAAFRSLHSAGQAFHAVKAEVSVIEYEEELDRSPRSLRRQAA